MNIAEISVRRPVAMTMVYVLICVVAAVFIPRLGIELYPAVELPILSVMTTYDGVGPDEVDENVTEPIVNAIKGVAGIEEINSTSQEGMSFVTISFGYGQDMDEAYDEINNSLSTITRMIPDDADAPILFQFDISSQPIMRLAIDGNLAIDELKTIAEDTVTPLVERVDGIASVDVKGGADRIIQVDVYNNRLQAYGITLSQISQALAARNIQLSSGQITQNGMDYEIITTEYFQSLDDIRETVITTLDGASITVADVSNVYETFEDSSSTVYVNGVPGIYLDISKESDANASTVSKGVTALLEGINADVPEGVHVSVLSDDTSLIDSTMNQVYSAGLQGVLLSVLVIILFLRNIKSAFIISLTLPISILITLMVMAFMDLTINMMTMSGLILGMGMVVDSSIVILENIFVYREQGKKSAVAAILGSKNMINAIVASTLTTLCVFIPLLIYQTQLEMFGEMFRDMVITVCASLVASLVVAITLVPALCGSILQIHTRTQKPLKNLFMKRIDDAIANAIHKTEEGYASVLKFCLKNKFLVISFVIALLILSVSQLLTMGLSLAPPGGADDQVTVELELPIGTSDEVVEEYLFEYQDIVLEVLDPEVYESLVLTVGASGRMSSGGSTGSIQINLPELNEQTMSATEIQNALRPYQYYWSNVAVTFSAGRGFGGGSSAIDVQIMSEDYEAAQEVAAQIEELMLSNEALVDVATDFEEGAPRFQIVIDSAKASSFGVSVSTIANEIKSAVSGSVATVYRADGNEYNIEVSLRDEDLTSTADLGSISVNTSQGRVSLDNFIIYSESTSPQSIARLDGERINHVTAGVADGLTSTEGQAIVEQLIAEYIALPESVEIEYGGDSSDITDLLGAFMIVILLAVFLVFAVMAAQFESLIDPFIIFASIPLLAIGVIGIYLITGDQLTVFSMVGVVALAGIVVNNGIVLVDYTNQLVDKKVPLLEACIEAGRNRLQPILMSTLTTVLGMVPLAFFPGEGAEMMQPIAMTIVGGLLTGSFMTLFISPVLYSMFNKKREKRFDNPNSLINQLSEFDASGINS